MKIRALSGFIEKWKRMNHNITRHIFKNIIKDFENMTFD